MEIKNTEECFDGAGDGSRTRVVWLETKNNSHYTTPAAFGMPRLELGPNPPKGLVLPITPHPA